MRRTTISAAAPIWPPSTDGRYVVEDFERAPVLTDGLAVMAHSYICKVGIACAGVPSTYQRGLQVEKPQTGRVVLARIKPTALTNTGRGQMKIYRLLSWRQCGLRSMYYS
jgi:hypothetical protein